MFDRIINKGITIPTDFLFLPDVLSLLFSSSPISS